MKLNYLLAALAVPGFIGFITFNKNPRRAFLLFVLCLLPVMDLPVTPVEWGRVRVFDCICYISLVFFFKDIVFIKKKHYYNLYYILFCLLILIILGGSLNSIFISNSLIAISTVFPVFIFAKLLITECDNDSKFQTTVIQCVKAVAIFSVVYLVIQRFVGLRFTFYPELNKNTTQDTVTRYPSFFFDPQMYGQYLVMTSFLFLVNFTKIERPALKNYFLFVVMLISLLLTGGRSAFLGIFAGIILLFFIFDYQYKLIIGVLCALTILTFVFFSDAVPVFSRVSTANDDYLFRAAIWQEASVFFKKNPLVGIGLGNYKMYNNTYSKNYIIIGGNEVAFFGYGNTENGYLMFLTELGILGFCVAMMFLLAPIFTSIKSYLYGNKDKVIFLIIASIVGWLVTFTFAYSLFDRRVLIVLVSLLSLLIVKSTKREIGYEG